MKKCPYCGHITNGEIVCKQCFAKLPDEKPDKQPEKASKKTKKE